MPDDTNKSKRPMNGRSAESFEDISKQFIEYAMEDRPYAGVRRNPTEMMAAIKAREDREEASSIVRQINRKNPPTGGDLLNIQSHVQFLHERESEFRKLGAANAMAFSEARRMSVMPNIVGSAANMVNTPTAQLQKRARDIESTINLLTKQGIYNIETEGVDTDATADVVQKQILAARELATTNAAVRMQKREGLDTESMKTRAAKFVGRFEGKSDLDDAAKKLIDTFNELNDAFSKNKDEAHGLGQEFERLRKEFEGGGGGGGGMGPMEKFGRRAMGVAYGTMAIANSYRYGAIDTPMGQVSNQAGYANIVNQQYNDIRAATGGDAAALMRITSGAYGGAAAFSTTLQGRERFATGLDTFSGAAATAGSVALAKASGFSALTGVAGGGFSNIASSASGLANSGMNLYYGTSAGQVGLQAHAAAMSRFNEMNTVGAAQLQQFMDYSKGSVVATRGAGAGRGGIYSRMMDNGFVSQMGGVGVDADQIMNMTAFGVGQLGNQFDTGMLASARMSERSGKLGMGQYLGALGTMATTGAGTKELETLMQNATAKGMDASKNIQMMVSATAALSSGSAAMGLGTFGGTSAVLDNMVSGGTNSIMSIGAAQSAMQQAAGIFGDRSISFSNVIKTARLENAFPGSNLMGARMSLAHLSPDQLSVLAKGTPDEKEKLLTFLGEGGDLLRDKGGKFNQQAAQVVIDAHIRSIIDKSTGLIDTNQVFDAVKSGNASDPILKKFRSVQLGQGQDPGMMKFMDAVSGRGGEVAGPPLPKGLSGFMGMLQSTIQAGEDLFTPKGTQGAKDIAAGKAIPGSVEMLSDIMNTVAEQYSPTKIAEAVTKAASDMAPKTVEFSGAVDVFSKAVSAFVKMQGGDWSPPRVNTSKEYYGPWGFNGKQ